jgi:hypothetical protein
MKQKKRLSTSRFFAVATSANHQLSPINSGMAQFLSTA